MKTKIITTLLTLLALSVTAINVQAKSWDDYLDWLVQYKRMKEVAPVSDKVYKDECGACHFPFQPGLLPAASWEKLMQADALANHFKENAELDEDTRKHILKLLTDNSADKSYYKRSRKIMWSLDEGMAPLRITEVPYIKDKHEEVAEDIDIKKSKVKSFANCDKCHQEAAKGVFDDDTVMIPDHGYWTW